MRGWTVTSNASEKSPWPWESVTGEPPGAILHGQGTASIRAKRRPMKHHWWTMLSLVTALVLGSGSVKAEVLDKTKNIGGTTVHYKVVLPKNYDAGKAYPGVLAFGGGPQTMNVVDSVIARNFRDEAEKRGYIVVAPAAPNDQLFFEGGERIFPEFLKQILADYKIQDNKFHIAGPSNGGIAAFNVAS